MSKKLVLFVFVLLYSVLSYASENATLPGVYGHELDAMDGTAIPGDFFDYNVVSEEGRAPGDYFISAKAYNSDNGFNLGFTFIMNPDDEIIFFRRYPGIPRGEHFIPFPSMNRMAIAFGGVREPEKWIIMDQSFTVVDSIVATENFILDGHEFLLEDDGTFWVETFDPRTIDMSQYVEGGNPAALVQGHSVYQLDADHQVIWEWHSLDHLDQLPFSHLLDQERLVRDGFQHVHLNAISIANDGNVLISLRTMSEVIKVNYDTREIMWIFGSGAGNQFTIDGDFDEPLIFTRQHDICQTEAGTYTLFDNGNDHDPRVSYGMEYQLDEENLTATLVWRYESDPPMFGPYTGSTRRLANGNTLIGWGGETEIGGTEVTPEGNVVWQISFPFQQPSDMIPYSYRYYKGEMNCLAAKPYLCENITDNDVTLYLNYFGHEAETESYNIYMGTDAEQLDLLDNSGSNVYLIEDLPYDTHYYLRITAVDGEGTESDYSNQVDLFIEENSVDEPVASLPAKFDFSQNWPNPFNSTTKLSVKLEEREALTLTIYDVLGREIQVLQNGILSAGSHEFEFNADDLGSGIYFAEAVVNGKQKQIRKMVLVR